MESFHNRKMYTNNTIKISNEKNHLGQYTIELVTIDPIEGTRIKQYKLYKNQLDILLKKQKQSNNSTNIEYVQNIDNFGYSNISNNNVINDYTQFSKHPEYSNDNNPLHLNSYHHTLNVKNEALKNEVNSNELKSNIGGYDNLSNNFSSFVPDRINNDRTNNDCDRKGG